MPRVQRGVRDDINCRLGALLRQRRRALGWSQVRLAGQLGVQGETISRIERGLHMPPLKKLHELCRAMRVSLAQLITEAERSERGQRSERSERSERGEDLLQELLMDLDAADREFVLETAARCARHLRRPR